MLCGVSPTWSAAATIAFSEDRRCRELSTASVQIARSASASFGRAQMPPYPTSVIKSSKPGRADCAPLSPRPAAICLPRSLTRLRDMVISVERSVSRGGEQLKNPFVQGGARPARMDRLDANVICARIPEKLDPRPDCTLVSPGDVGIHEAVGSAAGKVLVGKAKSAPVAGVVFELDIVGQSCACG